MVKKIDKSSFLIAFGAHLKKIREDKGMSQAQLAIDCDFDVSVISRIERGKVNTSVNNLKLIAEALDIQIQQLFDFM
ncbi:helix-turn-helix domain-containing protein [Flavobacterium sp. PLA-1-15]|uniref:helix-turn-helix domain-containing protein n=1 Tax=Flavobacterium sp. PLA-1-15 TaxID=3380533 RepID=UPI003B80402E